MLWSLLRESSMMPPLTVGEGGRLKSASKYSFVCARACVCTCICVVYEGFWGTGYLQLSLWEMSKSNRKGRGAWEDLHSASCVILLCSDSKQCVCVELCICGDGYCVLCQGCLVCEYQSDTVERSCTRRRSGRSVSRLQISLWLRVVYEAKFFLFSESL